MSLTYAVIATEIMSVLICLVLLYGNNFETRRRTQHGDIFSWLLITNIAALIADAIAWYFEDKPGYRGLLYVSNTLSIVLALVMIAQFALYITTYLKSHGARVNWEMLRAGLILSSCVIGITLIGCILGKMFYIDENGGYTSLFLYDVYSVLSMLTMVGCIAVVFYYRKSLGVHDSIAAYTYLALPTVSAFVNLYYEDVSFTYQSTTMAALLLYVMIQAEQSGKLMEEKQLTAYYVEHDELTGLLSRRAYVEKLERLKTVDDALGVIFSDLNGLKYTNDTYGHKEGDRLIREFADLLREHFREEDIYRISGDEYVAFVERARADGFYQRVEKLEKAIDAAEFPIACVGAAYGKGKDVNGLVQSAEALMYERKKTFHKAHPELGRSREAKETGLQEEKE